MANTGSIKPKVRVTDYREAGKGIIAFVEIRGNRYQFKSDSESGAVLGLRLDLETQGIQEEAVNWGDYEKHI